MYALRWTTSGKDHYISNPHTFKPRLFESIAEAEDFLSKLCFRNRPVEATDVEIVEYYAR